MKSFLAVVFLCVSMALLASANLRVAIHNNSCNSASLRPAYSTRLSITDQLNVDGMITASLLNDDAFSSHRDDDSEFGNATQNSVAHCFA